MSDIKKDTNKDISKKTDSNLQSNFSLFFKNEYHSFAVLKTEKLASALYMITGFIPENDPLRTQLRTCALDLVSCTTDAKRGRGSVGHEYFGSRCLEIGSMLSLAERAGLVSPMNAKILCDEYASLGSFVANNHSQVFDGELDVAAQLPAKSSLPNKPTQQGVSIGHVKKTVSKKTPNYKRHDNRRQIILSLFNKKDKINVKDAASAVQGCSEKTIQRELTAMVDEGVLFKEGERRWSVYRKAF